MVLFNGSALALILKWPFFNKYKAIRVKCHITFILIDRDLLGPKMSGDEAAKVIQTVRKVNYFCHLDIHSRCKIATVSHFLYTQLHLQRALDWNKCACVSGIRHHISNYNCSMIPRETNRHRLEERNVTFPRHKTQPRQRNSFNSDHRPGNKRF